MYGKIMSQGMSECILPSLIIKPDFSYLLGFKFIMNGLHAACRMHAVELPNQHVGIDRKRGVM